MDLSFIKKTGIIAAVIFVFSGNVEAAGARNANLDAEQESFTDLCQKLSGAEEIMAQQGICLNLNDRPMMVVGDLHGDIISLEACLNQFKEFVASITDPELKKRVALVFLGDYVDRGPHSVEILRTLAELKCRFPENVYLLRGNHEDNVSPDASYRYGLADEIRKLFPHRQALTYNSERDQEITAETTTLGHLCNEKYSFPRVNNENKIMTRLRQFFGHLPIFAVRNNYQLMHGYIPLQVNTATKASRGMFSTELTDFFSNLTLPHYRFFCNESFYGTPEVDRDNIITQILWNDPAPILPNTRGNPFAYQVPSSALHEFANNRENPALPLPPKIIIRAHEVKPYSAYLPYNTYNIFSSYFIFQYRFSQSQKKFIREAVAPSGQLAPVASVLKINSADPETPAVVYQLTEQNITEAINSLRQHFQRGREFALRVNNVLNGSPNINPQIIQNFQARLNAPVAFVRSWVDELNDLIPDNSDQTPSSASSAASQEPASSDDETHSLSPAPAITSSSAVVNRSQSPFAQGTPSPEPMSHATDSSASRPPFARGTPSPEPMSHATDSSASRRPPFAQGTPSPEPMSHATDLTLSPSTPEAERMPSSDSESSSTTILPFMTTRSE